MGRHCPTISAFLSNATYIMRRFIPCLSLAALLAGCDSAGEGVEDRVWHCCRDENEPRSDLNTTI